ncbi:7785_t:CDS:1, partial [Racocetra fulgida]
MDTVGKMLWKIFSTGNNEPDDQEFMITVKVHNKASLSFKLLLPNKNLAEIRNLLMKRNVTFRMGTNCYFSNEFHIIPREDEINYKLKDILQENILNIIPTSDPDWSQLIDMCDHGFKIGENGVEKARNKAFEIDTNKI